MLNNYDSHKIYCRKLGHWLQFEYCRCEREGLPCSLIRDCWFEMLPVDEYLQDNYSNDEIAALSIPRPSKVSSIMEQIQKAQKLQK